MRGFKNFDAAHRFCRAFDEVRNFLRDLVSFPGGEGVDGCVKLP